MMPAIEPRRLLVVKLSSLGDLFHALPAVHELKQQLGVSVDWVTQPEYAALVACFLDVNNVIPFPRRRFLSRGPAFLRALRAERYDLVVDLQGLLKSALVARLARAAARIGPAVCREGAGALYTLKAGSAASRTRRPHAVEAALDTVRYLGLRVGAPVFPVRFPAAGLSVKPPRIGLVPGSRWPSKNWPQERFAQLALALQRETGGTILLLDDRGGSELSKRLATVVPAAALLDLSGAMDLVQLGGVIRELDLLVTNDTGPMHLAAAVGTPVVAVFGPTDPARTGPWGDDHQVVRAPEQPDCAPCFRRHCRCREGLCLERVTVAAVLDAALRILKQRTHIRTS